MLNFIDDDLYSYFLSTDIGERCLLLELDMIPHIMLVDKRNPLYIKQGIREVHWNTKSEYIVYADLRLLYAFKFIGFDINNNVTVVIKWIGPKPIAYDALNLMYKSSNLILKTKLDKSYCFSFNSEINCDSLESIQSLLVSGVSIKCDAISLSVLEDKVIDMKYLKDFLNILNMLHLKNTTYNNVNHIYLSVDEKFLEQFDKLDKKTFMSLYKKIKEKKFKNEQFNKHKYYFTTSSDFIPYYLGIKNEFNHFLEELIG